MSEQLSLVKHPEGVVVGPENGLVVARTAKRNEWLPIVESAKALVISDAETKEKAVGHGRLLQASVKAVQEMYTEAKRGIDALKKPVLEAEKEDLKAINDAKDLLAGMILKWNQEQARLEAEALRKAREAARLAEEERRLEEAIAAEAAGEKEEAEQILNEPAMPMPSLVQTSTYKSAGEVGKTTYTAEVTDLKELVKAVAAGAVPIQAVEACQSFLNSQAKSFRQGLNYPGVKVNEKAGVHFRS